MYENEHGNKICEIDRYMEILCANFYRGNTPDDEDYLDDWDNFEQEPEILLEEIKIAVKFLKLNNSPGDDNVPAELLQLAGKLVNNWLWDMCTKVWKRDIWPKDWAASSAKFDVLENRLKPYVTIQIPKKEAGVKDKVIHQQIIKWDK